MTDKERKEIYIKKACEKFPEVVSREEINNLALKLDKQNLLWRCIGYIIGGIICLFLVMIIHQDFEETRMLLAVMSVSAVVEFFRTIGKYRKVKNNYGNISQKSSCRKQLTKNIVLSDMRKVSRENNNVFELIKVQLMDKKDESDVTVMNAMYHTYYLDFYIEQKKYTYKTNRNQYMEAAIGEVFYIAFKRNYGVVAAYEEAIWELDEELSKELSMTPMTNHVSEEIFPNGSVQMKEQKEGNNLHSNGKPKRILSIMSLICSFLMLEVNLIIGIVVVLAALFLGIMAVKREKTALAKVSLGVSIIAVLLLIFDYWYVLNYM